MALMPQTAVTALSSQNIAPPCAVSNSADSFTEEALFSTSLRKIISPKWRVVDNELVSFFLLPSELPATEQEITLNASLIGSATRHPTILCREMNR